MATCSIGDASVAVGASLAERDMEGVVKLRPPARGATVGIGPHVDWFALNGGFDAFAVLAGSVAGAT